MTKATAPLREKDRIDVIDIIRGFALLGILMMNIPYFSNAYQYVDNPTLQNFTGANYFTWWTVNGLFEGTMRGLFTILFGAGSILLLKRLESKPGGMAADIFYRRLLWLLLFGMINAFILLWPGDILYSYAICGLLIFPFRNMSARSLLIIAAAIFIFTVGKDSYRMYASKMMRVNGEQALALESKKQKLTPEQEEAKGKWTAYAARTEAAAVKETANREIAKMQQGYFQIMAHLRNVNVKLQTSTFYSSYFLDIMGLLFLGMALLKSGVLTASGRKRFYLLLMLGGYAIGLTSSFLLLRSGIASGFDSTKFFDILPVNLYQVKRLALSLGHLSLLILIYKSGVAKLLMQWLRSVGQMAFTNYLMQSIICGIIFYGFGFGLFGKLELYQAYYVVGCVWIFQIIFSSIWLHYFSFGPFEWVWRSLTYWKKQPMRRRTSQPEPEEEKTDEAPVPALG